MSNYSLSRVLSPFRVQTKFEENSLPARSNAVSIRYREIMVFCIVLGDNTEAAFPVKLPSDKKVGELRELIKKINSISFANIDAKDLILWQVDISDDDVGRMNILNTKPPSDINIEELEGKVMSSRKEINFYFPEDPANEHIHIIIVRPQPPTTTGKRRWDLYDGDEDQDRKKSKLTVPKKILTCVQKTMEDIMEISNDPNVYSNPENLISLPFPFIGESKPVERFSIHNNKFLYMGRKAFDKVLNIINELESGNGYMDFFIYGTMGYGKSYILATIVCFLLRTGKRVLYLPDCRQLAMDPIDYVKSALYLAYENDRDKISKIHGCETVDEIVKFCKEELEPLYIVVDQINVLDGHNNTEINESIKQQTIEFLSQMTTKHYYIKSSSANNTSAWHLRLKQTNERKIELYGGFDEDEMLQWWIKNNHNLPPMNDEQKKQIEYITGRNPLYLSFFSGFKNNFEDALDHLKLMLINKIEMPMTNFSDIIKPERRNIHIKLMSLCLTNGYAPSGYGINDYDHHFFYIDKDQRCHYTSGFVRDCMADYLFEKGNLEVFTTSSWIHCIKEFRNNPSVKGFMVEKACLASIWKNGLIANVINFKFDNYKFFTNIKEIDFSMNEGLCTFYLPRLWNQKSIDGLITFYKMKNIKEKVDEDTLYIAPIQITLDKKKHSDSKASFFSEIWPELKSKISGDLKVEVMFIWITCENDVDDFVEANMKILEERTIEINPQYSSIVMAFRCINNELEDILLY